MKRSLGGSPDGPVVHELRDHLSETVDRGQTIGMADIASLCSLCVLSTVKRFTTPLPAAVLSILGTALIGLGIIAAAHPFVSVQLLSDRALDELPTVDNTELVDDHRALAIFDHDEFILATRDYGSVPSDEIEVLLRASGFTTAYGGTPSQNGFGLDCCGEYDQLLVHLETVDDRTVATVTARDSDVTIVWPILLFLGGALAVVGVLLRAAAHSLRSSRVTPMGSGLTLTHLRPGSGLTLTHQSSDR